MPTLEKKDWSSYSKTKVTSAYKITSTTIHLWFLERGQGLIQHAFYFSLSIPNDHLPLWGKAGEKTCLLRNSKIIKWDSKNYLSLLLSRVPRFWVLNKTISSEAILALGIQSATHTIHSSDKNLHIMQILWLRIDNFPRRTPGWMQKSVSSWTELCRKAQNMHFNMSLISTISLLR